MKQRKPESEFCRELVSLVNRYHTYPAVPCDMVDVLVTILLNHQDNGVELYDAVIDALLNHREEFRRELARRHKE